ncbi:hypothetical protein D3C85_1892760 [compost metagenome]
MNAVAHRHDGKPGVIVVGRGDNDCVDQPAGEQLFGLMKERDGLADELPNGVMFFGIVFADRRQTGIFNDTR